MRRLLLLVGIFFAIYYPAKSQNLSFTCPRDTVLGCNATCFTLTSQIPDIRSSSADYYIGNVTPQSTCRPYIPPGAPGTSSQLSIDDKYSPTFTLPFGFSFYGRVYNSLVISTNGYISFSPAYANQFSHYGILNSGTGLSATTGTPVALPSTLIDSLVIMGPYHDIQPGVTTSPTQQIVYNVYGTAPNRKWILSYYKIPLFNCNSMIDNTHQIILHENTGIIEVFMGSRDNCTTWNQGRALIGIQNGNRTKGKMAPGRTAADGTWGTVNMNETWRFIPNSGTPLYRGVELLDASGTVVATGDTTRIDAGTFQTTFPNVCPPAGNSLFVVKTTYESIVTPGTFVYSLDTIHVLRTPNLPIGATPTATACGMSSGSITVNVAGGVAPYTYSIDGGPTQASNVFTNLPAGVHVVTATDANGCTNTINVTVTAVSSLTSTETHTNASCPGVNNGSITITPTAGSTPYQYLLNGGIPQASNVFSNLSGGNYTITFTDINGCTGTKSVTITTGSAITSTSSFTNTSCNGASDGTLTVTGTSGNAPYQYSLNGGTNQASGTFTGLVAGNYTVTITDANGCTGTKIVTISNGAAGLTMTVSVLPTGCPGASNGSVTITPTSGITPYTFSIDGSPFQSGPTFTGLSQGNHMVTIKDANGCTGTRVVGIGAGAALQSTIATTPASCAGNDGTIVLTPTTGTGPYTYSIDGGVTFQASNTFSNLIPGSYTITFQDAIGCSGTKAGTITSSTGITGTATASQTSCPGASNATITATSGSGTAPFTYSIDGGVTFQASNMFNSIAAGTYTITFKDNTGCTGTASVTVTNGPAITGTATATPTTCLGASDATLTVSPTIAGTYTYTLDAGASQASNIFNNVATGSHTASFQDAAGCIGTATVNVVAGPQVTATSTTTPASCPGATNGSITVTTSIAGTYTYSLDGGASQASNTFNHVGDGIHTITFQNTLGCSGTVNVTVSAGAGLTGTATSAATSCSGVNDGTITVTPSVASAYTYTLTPGGIVQNNNNLFTGLAPGTYSVMFQDNSSGCQGTVSNITVTQGAALTGTAVTTATSCPTVHDGTITVTPGGTGPYTFTLNPGAISQASNIFTNLAPGTYTIDFTTLSGCIGTVAGSFTIAAGPNRTSTTTLDQPDCANINDGIITIVPGSEAATPYATFTLTGPGGAISQSSNTFNNLPPGNYTYNFTDAIGCTGSGTAVLSTHSPLATTVNLTMPLCNGDANGVIALNASGGGAPYQYALSPFTAYQSSGTFNTTSGTYTIRIKDTYGCTKDTTVILNQPPVLTASAVSNNPAGCDGNDGTITVSAGGGTPAYQYSLDGTTFQASNNFITPTPGTFANISVKDNNGCTATASATVQLIDNMFLSIGNDTTICQESRVTFTPQTNTGTNIFQWRPLDATVTPPSTIIDPNIKNATVAPLDTAIYVLHAEWGACVREDTVLVRVLAKPIAYAGPDTAICDLSSAIISGSASHLSGTVNFAWTPADYAATPHLATTVVTPPKTQEFTLTVTDNYGCNFVVTDQVVVVVQPPVPAFAGRDTIAAIGSPHQLFGSGGVSFVWSPAAPLNLSTAQNPIAILYNDQQFVLKVTDYAGCIGYDTVFIQVYKDSGYYIPNAFSPNGDGLNDIFIATPVNIVKTDYFRIFNRLGQMVFETSEWRKGWDGRYLGKPQPIGAYIWVIQGIDKAGKVIQKKGTVLLVK